MQKQTGLSVSKLVRRALDLEAKSTKEAYDRGFKNGFGKLDIPCYKCGKAMRFDFKSDEEAREIVLRAFADWAHTSCLKGGN